MFVSFCVRKCLNGREAQSVTQLIIQNFDAAIVVSLLTVFLILVLRPLAIKVSLTDTPTARKTHQGQIPLTGGISIFFATCLTSVIFYETLPLDTITLLVCAGLSLLLGAIDDKVDLRASKKLVLQTGIALTFIISTGHVVTSLGSPIGFLGPMELGMLSIPFTVFAIVGLINAFNMIDGCDGLAASLVIISLLALIFVAPGALSDPRGQILLVLSSSTFVFLFFNFSNSNGLKAFLGDGGSLCLGFIVAASLVEFSTSNTLYDPSLVLWFAAIPILDFCNVIVRRKLLNRKIMSADRSHLHHYLLSVGISHFQTTMVILFTAIMLLCFGAFLEANYPSLSPFAFVGLFTIYLSLRLLNHRN